MFWGVCMRTNAFFFKDYNRYLSILQDSVEFSDLLCIFILQISRRSNQAEDDDPKGRI